MFFGCLKAKLALMRQNLRRNGAKETIKTSTPFCKEKYILIK